MRKNFAIAFVIALLLGAGVAEAKYEVTLNFHYNMPVINISSAPAIEKKVNDEIYRYMDYLYETYAREFYYASSDDPIQADINVISVAQVGNVLQILYAVEPDSDYVFAYFAQVINLNNGESHGMMGMFTTAGQQTILSEIKSQFLQATPSGRDYPDLLNQHIQEALYTIWLDRDAFYIFPDTPYLYDGGMFITKIPFERLKSSINLENEFAKALGLFADNKVIEYENHYNGDEIKNVQHVGNN